jgi:HEAT repeat protein
MRIVLLFGFLAVGILPSTASAQSLTQRIALVRVGTVHLSFAARPGICGDGMNNIRVVNQDTEWEQDCDRQPVRVALRVRKGRVTDVRSYVVGHWRSGLSVTDLGTVGAQEAAAYFVSLAEREPTVTGDVLFPATLADSVRMWPDLLRLARSPSVTPETRRAAVFWLGQAAEFVVTGSLDSIAGDSSVDRDVRLQAVFALSQRPDNQGVPMLVRIGRSNPDPQLRKTALFWLGQSDDPRALALFEEILR